MQGDFIREKLCDIEIKNSQDDNWINNINILTLSFLIKNMRLANE